MRVRPLGRCLKLRHSWLLRPLGVRVPNNRVPLTRFPCGSGLLDFRLETKSNPVCELRMHTKLRRGPLLLPFRGRESLSVRRLSRRTSKPLIFNSSGLSTSICSPTNAQRCQLPLLVSRFFAFRITPEEINEVLLRLLVEFRASAESSRSPRLREDRSLASLCAVAATSIGDSSGFSSSTVFSMSSAFFTATPATNSATLWRSARIYVDSEAGFLPARGTLPATSSAILRASPANVVGRVPRQRTES
jgi:hypothetical protein